MLFTTKVPISKSAYSIDYESAILTIGSCFAVNIAEKLHYYKFENTVNPFGILFHPLAIHEVIRRALQSDFYEDKDLFFHNECWHCYDTHSDVSAVNKEYLLQNLNHKLSDFKVQIENASHIFITYGTAWVYRDIKSQKIVANCHKMPQSQFQKELLTAEKIKEVITETITLIGSSNAKAAIVFALSPVRHLKDGFTENQQSKANLIIGIHESIPTKIGTIGYFPSYEIMMDELRDYRFYAEDMLHPNATAIQYIWDRFVSVSVTSETIAVMGEIESIQKALSHKPFHPDSEIHLRFRTQLQEKITLIEKQFPKINF